MILFGEQPKEKAQSGSLVGCRVFFYFHPFVCKLCLRFGLLIKNPCRFHGKGFFFVAECDQISNLELIKDLMDIVNMFEILD